MMTMVSYHTVHNSRNRVFFSPSFKHTTAVVALQAGLYTYSCTHTLAGSKRS